MSSATDQDLSNDRKQVLKKDLKEGLDGLRKIIIGAIALIINIGDLIVKNNNQISLAKYNDNNQKSKNETTTSLSCLEKKSDDTESVNVDVEIESSKENTLNNLVIKFLYPALATISTATLVVGLGQIDPIVKWAKTNNECVESISTIDGVNPATLESKVMQCNGGHAY
tara:strand:+ start:1834 stop:2340 length:507 start_codon:yes stop_codon:yes gene_type:complete